MDRILVCVDHADRRARFASALEAAPDFVVVGATTADTAGVLAAAGRQPAAIVIESARPGLEGAKFVARLRAVAPSACLLAVAAAGDRPRTVLARSLAADRYVEPDTAMPDLLEALAELLSEHRAGHLAS